MKGVRVFKDLWYIAFIALSVAITCISLCHHETIRI